MKKSIFFVGHGNWSKKIISIISKTAFFNEIFVKNRKKILSIRGGFKKNLNKKINFIHLCTPINIQKQLITKYSTHKNIIVEKNFNTTKKFLKKFQNKKNINVFYIDLYHIALKFIKKKILKKKISIIKINYEYNKKKYKNFLTFFNDWIDHPISLILYLFNLEKKINISKVQIKNFSYLKFSIKTENLIFLITINLQSKRKKNTRIISLVNKKTNVTEKIIYDFLERKLQIIDLNKKKVIEYSNDNPFINFYKYHTHISRSNLNFSNIVYEHKLNIYKQILLIKKNVQKIYK